MGTRIRTIYSKSVLIGVNIFSLLIVGTASAALVNRKIRGDMPAFSYIYEYKISSESQRVVFTSSRITPRMLELL